MSGAELPLAIVGVAIPLFEASIAAIYFIIDINHYEDDQAYLRLRLRLEKKRFQSWGEHAGLMVLEGEDGRKKVEYSLVFGKHRPTVQRAMVVDLLDQIQRLFDDFRQYQDSQAHKNVNPAEKGKSHDESTKEAGELEPKRREWMERAFKNLPDATKKGCERMRWASWDMGEFEKLVKKFKYLNDSMTDLLDSKIQQQIANTTQDTYRIVVQMATSFDQLERFVKATEEFSDQNEDHMRYQRLARFKAFHGYIQKKEHVDEKTLEQFTGVGESIRGRKLVFPQDLIKLYRGNKQDTLERDWQYNSTDRFGRSRGTYHPKYGVPRNVWIEWRNYKISATRRDEEPSAEVTDSVIRLARLLNHKENPTEFRVPHCLGYFDNRPNGRFGFVFEPPPEAVFP